jgi:hypothetical protein
MELSHMHRVVAALLTLLFAALGVTFWVVPEQAAYRLGLEAVGVTGLSALRADVGGLFVGLALLCAAAAWTRRRSWLFAATLVLGAIVLGRSFGWAVEGRVGILGLAVELAVLGLLAVCIYGSRRSVVVTGDLKFHSPLAKAAADADILVSEAIATSMTRALGRSALGAGRDRTAAIMHDIEDYHITPEEAARIANEARVKLLVFYHLLPAPDGFLTRRLFSQGVNAVRRGDWTIADDGSLYTLPIGSTEVRIGRVGG